jgi:hypothetical protein
MPNDYKKNNQEPLPNASDAARGADYTQRFLALRSQLQSAAPRVMKAVKGTPLFALGTTAVDAAQMTDPQMRQEAIDQTYQDAEKAPWYDRMAKGFFNPVQTSTGMGAMLGDLIETRARAKKAEANAPSEAQLLRMYLDAKQKKALQKLKRADKSTEEMRDRVYIGDQLT